MSLVVLPAMILPLGVRAEVVDSIATGFEVRSTASIAASPDSVYRALVYRISDWWDPEHTWSWNAKNVSIDPRPGGCLCEKLPGGGGVEHMTVIYVAPGKLLRMRGALGPMQASGLSGVMTWEFKSVADGTTVEQTYSIGGFYKGGLQALAPVVDSVLGGQLRRLKLFIETGTPKTE